MQTYEGGCLCESIRYRVSGTPSSSIICHCNTCRRASGAPSVAWLTFDRDQVETLSGTPLTFESSPGVVRRFCGVCGSAISYENRESPDIIDMTTLSLDDPAVFPPTREVWLTHKISWEATNESLGQYPTGSDAGPYP